MPSLNRVQIMGHLGKEPETRYLPDGTPTTSFSVAASESWTDKTSGQKKESTEWFNVVTWRGLSEICAKYLYKGALVYVEGKLKTRSWEKDGIKRYIIEVVASEVKFLSKRQGGPPQPNYDEGPPVPTEDDDIPF